MSELAPIPLKTIEDVRDFMKFMQGRDPQTQLDLLVQGLAEGAASEAPKKKTKKAGD